MPCGSRGKRFRGLWSAAWKYDFVNRSFALSNGLPKLGDFRGGRQTDLHPAQPAHFKAKTANNVSIWTTPNIKTAIGAGEFGFGFPLLSGTELPSLFV
jgi:hypothetical protein